MNDQHFAQKENLFWYADEKCHITKQPMTLTPRQQFDIPFCSHICCAISVIYLWARRFIWFRIDGVKTEMAYWLWILIVFLESFPIDPECMHIHTHNIVGICYFVRFLYELKKETYNDSSLLSEQIRRQKSLILMQPGVIVGKFWTNFSHLLLLIKKM